MKKNIKAAIVTGAASLFWLVFIFSNSLKSKAASARQSEGMEGIVRKLIGLFGFSGDVERVAEIVVRKSAHVFEFFVLAALLTLTSVFMGADRKKGLIIGAVAAFLAACADEGLQIISHRGASVRDVLIDSIGVVVWAVIFRKRINNE